LDVYPAAATMPAISDIDAAVTAWADEIRKWLDRPRVRRAQADYDYQTTISRHTYRHRAETFLAALRELKK
jgi:spore maturation protein CgeB